MSDVEFYFDYRSPYSYMANTQVPKIAAGIVYRPIDLVTLLELAGNPARTSASPNKFRYGNLDLARWAKIYGVPYGINDRLREMDSKLLANGAIAAQRLGVFDTYHAAVFHAAWPGNLDLASPEGRDAVLTAAGLDARAIWDLAASDEIAGERDENARRANEAGAFGTPSFVYEGELFFGNDRLGMLNDRIREGTQQG